MHLLSISGSARTNSTNIQFLKALPPLFPNHQYHHFSKLHHLPLFHADWQDHPDPPIIKEWKAAVQTADALIICSPEYLHNLPAVLKNALEWLTASGEMAHKKVLAMTFTPHPPRGEKAMQSLIWSLQALDARVVAQLPLYQNEVSFDEAGNLIENETVELMKEAIRLLF